jgi:predicted outer membrane repeat protein
MTFQKNTMTIIFAARAMKLAAAGFNQIRTGRFSAALALLICFFAVNQAQAAATITVTNNNDSGAGSLRQAVIDAADGDTINFASNVTGTITLTSGAIFINEKSLTITGPGARVLAISGNNENTIFFINDSEIFTVISGLTIRDGFTGEGAGGGIFALGGLVLRNMTFTNNEAAFGGGAIYLDDGFAEITNTTINGNTVGGGGGGIFNDGAFMIIVNSTISGNTAEVGLDDLQGGGILNLGFMLIINSTVTENTGAFTGGIHNVGDGVNIINTIVAGNTGTTAPDADGAFNSYGNNLIGSTMGNEGFGEPDSNDIVNVPAQLAPLANNGGQTDTHALLPTSPAVDAGNNCILDNNCGDGANLETSITTDQRGVTRPQGANVDIGSFELINEAALAINLVVSPDPVSSGGVSTYQMTLVNNGDLEAQSVVLTQADFFRRRGGTRLTVESIKAPAGWTCRVGAGLTDPPTAEVVCRGTLAPKQQAQFTIVKRQRTPLARGTIIDHEAQATTETFEMNKEDNRATDTTNVQ